MDDLYLPPQREGHSYLRFWGTRGSIPVSGSRYVFFGGDTCCLEVRSGRDLVIVDAGTGIRPLGEKLLSEEIRDIHLFIGHTHWDHIIGFPFFAPLYHPGFTVHVYGPTHEGRDPKSALQGILQPENFPVGLRGMKADIAFHFLRGGESRRVGTIDVSTILCDHPGSALGFRFHLPEVTFGYFSDNELFKGYLGHPATLTPQHPLYQDYEPIVEFVKECDLLIHEAQYTPQQYQERIGWGHSSMSNAAALMRLAGIEHWIVSHHDPAADDEHLKLHLDLQRQILRDAGHFCHFRIAYDGMRLML